MPTSVKLDQQLKNRIQQLADMRDRTTHWIMLQAIKEYVEREEAREKFKEEALSSWQTFQETGLHLSLQETNQWLDTWGTDEEGEAPNCHE